MCKLQIITAGFLVLLPFLLFCVEGILHESHLEKIRNRDSSVFENYEVLDSQRNYVLEWIVNWKQNTVLFKVTVKTKGYVALGLSKKGLMAKADIVIGGVLPTGTPYFSDRYGVDHEEPVMDKSQDWHLHEARENDTHTFLSFSRPFNTCDKDDYQINEFDVINLIWAYGHTDNPGEYHKAQHRGHYPVYLLDPNVIPRPFKESSFIKGGPPAKILADYKLRLWTVSTRYRLTRRNTAYVCTMHKGPKLGRKHHIVGYHVRLETEEALKRTHHLMLYRCIPPFGSDPVHLFNEHVGGRGELCYFLSRPTGKIPMQYCTQVTSPFATGGRIMFFPDHLSSPVGYSPDEYYLLQVHYNNPDGRIDLDIDINLDLYYTNHLRSNELATLTIGHHIPGSPSILVPPSSPSHNIFGHCGKRCTKEMLPPEGINIFMIVQHTHYSGRRVRIQHIRGNEELPWISEDNNFDGSFQAYRILRNEVNVKPGDHLMIRCVYDSTWKNGSVVGGFSASNEMCGAYLFYYNRLEHYSLCRSEIVDDFYMKRYLKVTNITWNPTKLDYVATAPRQLAGLSMEEIANTRVSWTPRLRQELQQDHMSLPQVNTCSKSPFSSTGQGLIQGFSDVTFEADHGNIVFVPSGIKEYTPPRKNCNNVNEFRIPTQTPAITISSSERRNHKANRLLWN